MKAEGATAAAARAGVVRVEGAPGRVGRAASTACIHTIEEHACGQEGVFAVRRCPPLLMHRLQRAVNAKHTTASTAFIQWLVLQSLPLLQRCLQPPTRKCWKRGKSGSSTPRRWLEWWRRRASRSRTGQRRSRSSTLPRGCSPTTHHRPGSCTHSIVLRHRRTTGSSITTLVDNVCDRACGRLEHAV